MARYDELASDLRRRLAAGDFGQVGDKLPPLKALMGEYEVTSVQTMRAAQGVLVAEGLLRTRQGSGVFITAIPGVEHSETQELIDLIGQTERHLRRLRQRLNARLLVEQDTIPPEKSTEQKRSSSSATSREASQRLSARSRRPAKAGSPTTSGPTGPPDPIARIQPLIDALAAKPARPEDWPGPVLAFAEHRNRIVLILEPTDDDHVRLEFLREPRGRRGSVVSVLAPEYPVNRLTRAIDEARAYLNPRR